MTTPTNDFVTFASQPGASVQPLSNYQSNPATATGVTTGIADPTLYNRAQRQSSMAIAALSTFIQQNQANNVYDDGNVTEFITNFQTALVNYLGARQTSQVTITGATYTYSAANLSQFVHRYNSGNLMTDTIPGANSGGALPAGIYYVSNIDSGTLLQLAIGNGSVLDGGIAFTDSISPSYILLGPGQAFYFASDGTNYWTIERPERVRIVTAGHITVYVDGTNGNDSNPGLTSGSGAMRTLQGAFDAWQSLIDLWGGVYISFSIANSVGPLLFGGGFVGQNYREQVEITTASTAATITSATANPSVWVYDLGQCYISGGSGTLTLTNTGGGSIIQCNGFSSVIEINNIILGATTGYQLFASNKGAIITSGGEGPFSHSPVFTVSAGAESLAAAAYNGTIQFSGAPIITFSNALTYSQSTVACGDSSYIFIAGVSWVGKSNVTGTRYAIADVSLIDTGGGGASYIPGNAAGPATSIPNTGLYE